MIQIYTQLKEMVANAVVKGSKIKLDGRTTDIAAILALVIFVLVLRPILAADFFLGYGSIASRFLVWMLFAASFNLLLGYTGLLSFGHAAFLGTGMYVVAITLSSISTRLFIPAAFLALIVTGLAGYSIASLIADRGEIYFAMLTLAFGEIFWYIANADPYGLTGGSDGLAVDILPVWISTYRGNTYVALGGMQIELYWLIAISFIAAIFLLFRIVRSPFGRTLIAIRENENLARAVGVDVTKYKIYAFTMSATFTGFVGVLYELVQQGVTTNALHWSTSGDIVIMTILGGMNSFVGPMLGAFVWQFAAEFLPSLEILHLPLAQFAFISIEINEYMTYWRFLFGLAFVLVVLTRPKSGIWGGLREAATRAVERISAAEEEQ